jgi:chorismate mutase
MTAAAPHPPIPPEEAQELLDAARKRISEVDDALIRTIGERRDLVLAVARAKEALGRPVLDPAREAAVVRRAAERARELGVDEEMTRDVIWRIIAAARATQEGRLSGWPDPEPLVSPPSPGTRAHPPTDGPPPDGTPPGERAPETNDREG